MIVFISVVAAIFVVVSIYYYFRSERLHHDLIAKKRESAQALRDNKQMLDTFALLATKQEEFYLSRYSGLKKAAEKQAPLVAKEMTVLWPIINNFAAIYRGCAMSKEPLQGKVKACYESFSPGAFDDFKRFLGQKQKPIKNMWSSNNLIGFVSLVEALLVEFQADIARTRQSKGPAQKLAEEAVQN